MKTVVILQSCYVPWKGYFDLMSRCDEFVFYDDTQFTKRDWRSRNRIKTAQGVQWLTIPVETKGKFDQLINQTRVSDRGWAERHWDSIRHAYRRAAHFDDQQDWLRRLYETAGVHELLSDINLSMTSEIAKSLGIKTRLSRSESYPGKGRKSARLIEICRAAGADTYLSGPSAQDYIDLEAFAAAGIAVQYFSYQGYPEYPQLHGPFVHDVSIIDAFFNLGPKARHALDRAGMQVLRAAAPVARVDGLN